jgi:Na+-translocating ferredoxin:NAD+ oxidoreductase RnfC subunit
LLNVHLKLTYFGYLSQDKINNAMVRMKAYDYVFRLSSSEQFSLPLFSPVSGYSENMVAHRKHPHFAILVTATLHTVHQNRPKQEG